MTEQASNDFEYTVLPPDQLQGGMIHRAMLAVIAEIPAVDKNGEMTLGGKAIKFTRIDDIRDALNPILLKHGIVSYPRVLEKKTELQVAAEPMTMVQFDENKKLLPGREIRDGKLPTTRSWAEVTYEERYVFVGDNSETTASAAGQSYDSGGDKALAKATTAAIKRILFEVFKITDHSEGDDEARDADAGNRAATTDRREGGDRGQQSRTAAANAPLTGSTRRTAPRKTEAAAQVAEETGADVSTGEVPDLPAPNPKPEPTNLEIIKKRVRDAVAKLKARDGEGSWSTAEVDALATQVTGKASRPDWINTPTHIGKVADALEEKLK